MQLENSKREDNSDDIEDQARRSGKKAPALAAPLR